MLLRLFSSVLGLMATYAGAGRGFALANHARQAGSYISNDVSFAVQRDAALEAVAIFDSSRARELLLGAQAVAAKTGGRLTPELERVLGDACLAVDDVEGAKGAFTRVLEHSQDSMVRAGAYTGLSRLSMGSLNTHAAFAEAGRALQTLGLTPITPSLFALLGAAIGVVWLVIRNALFGPGRQRPTDEFASQLYAMGGFAGYFLFDRKLLLAASLRGFAPSSRLPPNRATAESYAFSSVISAVVGAKGVTASFLKAARRIATQSNDPAAHAMVSGFEALATDMGGSPLEGERLGIAAIENGARMDVSSYLTVIGGVTWNVCMRGQARKALNLINHGTSRMESTGQSLIARGHTFRSYSGTTYALLGQPEKARKELDDYSEFLKQHAPDDVFRHILLIGHEAFFLHLSGASDEVLEACFDQHQKYGAPVSQYVMTLRHILLAKAMRRGDQVVADPRNGARLADAQELVKTLKSFGKYVTLVLHRELLEAKINWALGQNPVPALKSLRERAERVEAPWLVIEAMIAEAGWLRANSKVDEADAVQKSLESIATQNGLLGLLERSRRLSHSM